MHNAKKKISELKEYFDRELDKPNGINMTDIPKIANMIQSIEIIEQYICDYEMGKSMSYEHTNYSSEEWLLNQVEDELDGSQTYYDAWINTDDPKYKTLAKEELGHANKLMETRVADSNNSAKMQNYMTRYQEMSKVLA